MVTYVCWSAEQLALTAGVLHCWLLLHKLVMAIVTQNSLFQASLILFFQHETGNVCEVAVCNAGCQAHLAADASRPTVHYDLSASLAVSVFGMAVVLSQRYC